MYYRQLLFLSIGTIFIAELFVKIVQKPPKLVQVRALFLGSYLSILPQAVNPPCKTPEVPAVTGSEVSREQPPPGPVISLADHSDRHVGSIMMRRYVL